MTYFRSEERYARLQSEVDRLQAALFKIQCEQLDRATNKGLSAQRHRKLAMATRDWIIAFTEDQKP